MRLTPSAGVLTATLTATADATEIRLYSDTGNTTDCELYIFLVYGNDRPVTSIVINLINEAQNSREYAERGIRVSGYSTFKNTSQNTFEVNGDGTGYGEVRLSMLPIKSDGSGRETELGNEDSEEGIEVFGVVMYCVNDMRRCEWDDLPVI